MVKKKEVSESLPAKKEYKGNEFVTADAQRAYADLIDEMRGHPVLSKIMLSPSGIPPDWHKVNAIVSFLILKKLEDGK